MNRPFWQQISSVLERFKGSPAHRRKKLRRPTRRFSFEMFEDRSMLAGASISGFAFILKNPGGFTPGQDIPQPGVTIDLFKTGVVMPMTMVTDVTGFYKFDNLADGHYTIQEVVPTGYTQNAGPPFTMFDVIGGAVFNSATQSIDDFTDTNGQKSFVISALNANPYVSSDPGVNILGGIRNLNVTVLTAMPNAVSAAGHYGAGTFFLNSDSGPAGTEVTMQYNGVAPNNDLTANGNNGIRLDFNFLQWLQTMGEIADVHITATSPGGTASFTTNFAQHPSDAFSLFVPFSSFSTTGSFTFSNVTSLQFTFNQADVPAFDFEIDQIVAAQQANPSFNFGNFPIPSSLSGFKYVDSNNNAHKDPGEPPIGGVIITLTGTNDLGQAVNVQTQTLADGSYSFTGLRPGTYTLTETPPINFIIGQPTLGSLGGVIMSNLIITSIVVPPAAAGVNYDFGELGLTPPFVSKRSLLNPPQPVILTAVYTTTTTQVTAPVSNAKVASTSGVTTTAKVTPKKPAPKHVAKKVVAVKKHPAPKLTVKPPISTVHH